MSEPLAMPGGLVVPCLFRRHSFSHWPKTASLSSHSSTSPTDSDNTDAYPPPDVWLRSQQLPTARHFLLCVLLSKSAFAAASLAVCGERSRPSCVIGGLPVRAEPGTPPNRLERRQEGGQQRATQPLALPYRRSVFRPTGYADVRPERRRRVERARAGRRDESGGRAAVTVGVEDVCVRKIDAQEQMLQSLQRRKSAAEGVLQTLWSSFRSMT